MTALGTEAISIYKTMTWTEALDSDKLEKVLEAVTNYYELKVTRSTKDSRSYSDAKQPDETVGTY